MRECALGKAADSRNATVYNGRGSQVYDMAREMLAASEGHIAHWKSMEHHLTR